ncbi:MAG: BLUF domain-containing protein [Gammaproteobacteria bacterium]|nr:BLUF domain-containing protein [Gammaproteobacteria bacterium]
MLCYTSRPIPGLEHCRLRALVQRAREANAAAGITGCLLFDGQQIVQVLEGDEAAVEALFARIQRDPRHERIRMLWQGTAHRREFTDQPMACYNLAWRRMLGGREPQQALDDLVASRDVGLTDIVSLARLFKFLRLPGWPEAQPI